MAKTIPEHLMSDRKWSALFFLFTEHDKLSTLLTTDYIDPEKEHVYVRRLRNASKKWSESEQYMLELALHLFNPSYKLQQGLIPFDYLDSNNTELALKAISNRYQV